jgi:hypothetical protein
LQYIFIYFNKLGIHDDGLKNIKSPLILKFKIKTNYDLEKNTTAFSYLSIRYLDGSIKPIWLKKDNIEKNQIIEICSIIPYIKAIQNIFVTFSCSSLNDNEEIELIEISLKYFQKNNIKNGK